MSEKRAWASIQLNGGAWQNKTLGKSKVFIAAERQLVKKLARLYRNLTPPLRCKWGLLGFEAVFHTR
jgi:hypothetical protein